MNLENTQKLFQNFSELFDIEMLNLGVECQDGWFELIYLLAGDIKEHYFKGCGKVDFKILRIRPEAGRMRIYSMDGDKTVMRMIQAAENTSESICELDGEAAAGLYVCAPNWFRYLCEKCAHLHGCMTFEDYQLESVEIVPEHDGTPFLV